MTDKLNFEKKYLIKNAQPFISDTITMIEHGNQRFQFK